MEVTNLEILLINLALNKPKYLQIFPMNGDENQALKNSKFYYGKGQLNSKGLFAISNSSKKQAKAKKTEFICTCLGRIVGLKKTFRPCLTFR